MDEERDEDLYLDLAEVVVVVVVVVRNFMVVSF